MNTFPGKLNETVAHRKLLIINPHTHSYTHTVNKEMATHIAGTVFRSQSRFLIRPSFTKSMSAFSSSSTGSSKLRIACCQLLVGANKQVNIENAERAITAAAAANANADSKRVDLVVLPEIWNSPYANTSFPENAEIIPKVGDTPSQEASPSLLMLCNKAREHQVWIVGGSIPERAVDSTTGDEKIFNTCPIINSNGELVAKHRKMHLFDIDVPGKITFKESDTLTAGNQITVVDTPWGNIGVGICYDMRFPELAQLMRNKGCKLLVYPGAFNMTTGPAHWELLQRARAVDNQLYFATCSPARVEGGGYVAWGHSSIITPWGDVIAKADAGQETITADLDFEEVDKVRQNIPTSKQKRHDIYTLVEK
jgi:omega-amidase